MFAVFHHYKQDFGEYSHAFFLEHRQQSFSREIYPSHLLFHKGCLSMAIYMAVASNQSLLRNSSLRGGEHNGPGRLWVAWASPVCNGCYRSPPHWGNSMALPALSSSTRRPHTSRACSSHPAGAQAGASKICNRPMEALWQ